MTEGSYKEHGSTVCTINVENLKDPTKEKDDTDKRFVFREKEFKLRDSIITTMMKSHNFRSFYNIVVSLLFLLMLETLANDYYKYGRIYFMTRTLATGFGKFHIAFLMWIAMQIIVLLLYYAFQFWAYIRYLVKNNNFWALTWNLTGMTIFVLFEAAFFLGLQCGLIIIEFPIATGVAVAVENVRFMMKIYAFIRTNAPLRMDKMEHSYNIKTYIYFLFAPTLIYRDEYPRTEKIRWKFVTQNILEFFGTIFFLCYFYERILDPLYNQFGKKKHSLQYLIYAFFATLLPSYMIIICVFYNVYQAWLNLAAELLRFGDRKFYRKWWTSSDYSTFYRTWNAPIHEWLHEYIYKDVYRYIFKGSKFFATLIVTVISAGAHEIILISSLRFFYPVMFIMFAFVGMLAFYMNHCMPKWFGNIFFWLTISMGVCTICISYSIEYYTRINCPSGGEWINYIIPATWRYNFFALLWDLTGITIFVLFQMSFFLSLQYGVFIIQFPIATGLAIVFENVRFMMKMHAFVRTNGPLRLHKKEHTYNFKTYLYFVFAPTLIYRDEYPRTEKINWRFVTRTVLEFFGTIFFLCYFYEKFLDPFFSNFGNGTHSVLYLINVFFTTMVPTYLIVLCVFYNLFQAWLNFFAELLRFGDRRFYRAWWLSTNYGNFYRTWNAPVHEWLHEYIYKDVYRYIFKGSRLAGVMTVVFISALFHEILLISVLRFVYPVLFFLFGIMGTLATYMTRSMPKFFGNFFFWFTIPLGVCIMCISYTIEHYSRRNCPPADGWIDLITPATWRCEVFDFS